MCVTCEVCNDAWFICPFHNRRWNSRHQYVASQHFNNALIIHPSIEGADNVNNPETNKGVNNHEDDTFDVTHNIESNNNYPISDVISFSPMSINSQRYFSFMAQNPDKIPAQYLVHSAFNENSVFSTKFCNLFETEFHLQATQLCLTMSHLQHVQLRCLFHMLESCINYSSDNSKFVSTRIPTSMSEVNTFYLNKSTSIRKSLPYPKAEELHNHAFIRLKDVLLHMFAYGTKMEGICPYENHDYSGTYVGESNEIFNAPFIHQTINKILEKFPPSGIIKPLILFGTLWSDGFDANNVVHNAPSIWIRTITIAPPHDETTSTLHTFVLHMSHEGINHDKINGIFNEELETLEGGTWFYSTLLKKSIFVILKIHVYAADRPERGKLTYLLGHTGTSTKRWMYSAYLPKSTEKPLQSCDACFHYRVEKAKRNPKFGFVANRRCTHCADWDYDHINMKVLKPDGYPKSYHRNSPDPYKERRIHGISHLQPMILSFDKMKESANFIFFNVYKKSFNNGEANVYGKSAGLSGECIKDIIINQAKSSLNTNKNLPCGDILSHFKHPPIWDCPIALKMLQQCI